MTLDPDKASIVINGACDVLSDYLDLYEPGTPDEVATRLHIVLSMALSGIVSSVGWRRVPGMLARAIIAAVRFPVDFVSEQS